MFMMPSAIKGIIAKNRQALAGALEGLQAKPKPDIYDLTLQITGVIASLDTLENLIAVKEPDCNTVIRDKLSPESGPMHDFEADVEDDDPEHEDADKKKARLESRGFYG